LIPEYKDKFGPVTSEGFEPRLVELIGEAEEAAEKKAAEEAGNTE
jgi:hypothetical protein